MQCVIVLFPAILTFYLLSSYSSIFLIKIQQKSGEVVIRGGGGYYAIPRTQRQRI